MSTLHLQIFSNYTSNMNKSSKMTKRWSQPTSVFRSVQSTTDISIATGHIQCIPRESSGTSRYQF